MSDRGDGKDRDRVGRESTRPAPEPRKDAGGAALGDADPIRSTPGSLRSTSEVTLMLNKAAHGDSEAGREVLRVVYAELRRIAEAKRRAAPRRETLRTTALVHEAYLRVLDREPEGWEARSHFYRAAARAMRDIVVEDARRRAAERHGGALEQVDVDLDGLPVDAPPENIWAVERCLEQLEAQDDLGYQIVMFRFFVGLTIPEVAAALQTSVRSVERKWTFLRAWLQHELTSSTAS